MAFLLEYSVAWFRTRPPPSKTPKLILGGISVKDQCVSIDVFYVCAFWGDRQHLDRLIQAYATEKAALEARRQGHTVVEQLLPDGSIKLTIGVGSAA
jgi:hypothetical protein